MDAQTNETKIKISYWKHKGENNENVIWEVRVIHVHQEKSAINKKDKISWPKNVSHTSFAARHSLDVSYKHSEILF